MPKKEAVLIGAGKIGRGYLAELFSAGGYHLTFLEYSEDLTKALRQQGKYLIIKRHADGTHSRAVISGYDAFCTQTEYEQCVDALCRTNYASVHVFPGACESIGHMVADAIKKRVAQQNGEPLDIYICVNFLNATQIFSKYIQEKLETPEQKQYFRDNIGLSETLVQRNGANPQPEMLREDPLVCYSSDVDFLPVDADPLKGEPPQGVNFVLKHNVPGWMVHKIWVSNMSHCITALYGQFKGKTYIGESGQDPDIMRCAILAKSEANFAVCHACGFTQEQIEQEEPQSREEYFADSANDNNKDTCLRVAQDMKRKLAKGDRLIGPALCCIQNGRMPYFLSRGAALGFYFKNPADPGAVEIQKCVLEEGIGEAVSRFCGLSDDVLAERLLKQLIVGQYYELSNLDPFDIHYE